MTAEMAVETPDLTVADLRLQLAEFDTAIALADAELMVADEAVAAAQADFDEQQRSAMLARQAALAGTTFEEEVGADPTTGLMPVPRTAEDIRAGREAAQFAEGRRDRADRDLQAALVARTGMAQRRGHHLMMQRRTRAAIEQAEAERQRLAAIEERSLLASIRSRVLGRVG